MFRSFSSIGLLALTSGLVHADTPLWINRPEAAPWLLAVARAADRSALPPALIAEIVGMESGFQPTAKNPHSSAYGCGQQIAGNRIMIANRLDRRSCADSIMGAALELRQDLDRTGSLERAVAAYGTTSGMTPSRRKTVLARLNLAARWVPILMATQSVNPPVQTQIGTMLSGSSPKS